VLDARAIVEKALTEERHAAHVVEHSHRAI